MHMTTNNTARTARLALAAALASAAGDLILRMVEGGSVVVGRKERGEVVTTADRASNRLICSAIWNTFPGDGFYSEESPDDERRVNTLRTWIVDPLDSTSSFVGGGDEFSVSIGLAVAGRPLVGAVCNPRRRQRRARCRRCSASRCRPRASARGPSPASRARTAGTVPPRAGRFPASTRRASCGSGPRRPAGPR